jgi:hypothetical protein
LKAALLLFIALATSLALGQAPSTGGKPLSRDQLLLLISAGMDPEPFAETVQKRGLGFEVTGEDFEAMRKAGASKLMQRAVAEAVLAQSSAPLRKEVLPHLMGAGVSEENLVKALQQRGVDSPLDAGDFDNLVQLGAGDAVIRTLREVNPRPMTRGWRRTCFFRSARQRRMKD